MVSSNGAHETQLTEVIKVALAEILRSRYIEYFGVVKKDSSGTTGMPTIDHNIS